MLLEVSSDLRVEGLFLDEQMELKPHLFPDFLAKAPSFSDSLLSDLRHVISDLGLSKLLSESTAQGLKPHLFPIE